MAKIVETKNRRISINAMDSIMKTQYENINTECWNEIDITIKRTISLGDMLSFVNDVVASLCLKFSILQLEATSS